MQGLAHALPVDGAQVSQGEVWKSLSEAIVAIARAEIGVRLSRDDLSRLVPLHSPSWETLTAAPSPWGLLGADGWERNVENQVRQVGPLRSLIEAEGLDFWKEELDEHYRIVDTRWLDSHADAYRWVHGPWTGGNACRWCGIGESPVNPQVPAMNYLFALETERRHGYYTLQSNGVVLPDFCVSSSFLLHRRCTLRWVSTCLTVQPYLGVQEAAEADRKAGRKSRWPDVQTSARALAAPKGVTT